VQTLQGKRFFYPARSHARSLSFSSWTVLTVVACTLCLPGVPPPVSLLCPASPLLPPIPYLPTPLSTYVLFSRPLPSMPPSPPSPSSLSLLRRAPTHFYLVLSALSVWDSLSRSHAVPPARALSLLTSEQKCGTVTSWKRVEDVETKKPKGFGFCEVSSPPTHPPTHPPCSTIKSCVCPSATWTT